MISRDRAMIYPPSSVFSPAYTLRLAGLALVLLVAWQSVARAAGVYYVDNSSSSCSNSGPGTEAQPYCTISAAVSARGGAGTTIYVKPGTYREQVSINASGASGSPFVIQALGGTVTIDGADDFSSTGSWTVFSGSVYRASAVTWSPAQVLVDDTRLTKSTASPASIPVNSFVYVSGEGLYVNLGGANPGSRQTKVGRRSYGFSMYARSYVTIDGFNVVRADDRGFNLGDACTNVTIKRNRASYCFKYGVYANGGSSLSIGSNVVVDNGDHGMAAISGVTGSTFEDNEFARNAHPTVRSANGLYLYGATNNVLRRNRFHDNQDTGLQIQSGSSGNLCYLNRSWNNGDHGYDHLFATNNTHIGDVAYGNYKDGFSIEGNATGHQLYDCIAVNNGLTTNEFNLWVDSASIGGFVSDYNIFWNSTSQAPIKYGSTTYSTLTGYQAASGQDAHSTQANPRFANPAGGDFHLLAGSPAIDSGTSGVASWPSLDADGVGRADDPGTPNTGAGPILFSDRGAYEFVNTTVPHAPVVNAPANVSGTENVPLTVNITAADADGDPITSLTATGLPPGASFTAGAGNTTGQLTWTPSFSQAGIYNVTFTASNALSGSATTRITIATNDRAPVVTAPANASGSENSLLTLNVTASDPDGDAITSLTVSGAPGATFTPGPGNTSGQLTWTPSFTQAGVHTVTFTATNARTGSASTVVTIANVDRAPQITAPAAIGVRPGFPLIFQVTVSDPDGDAITTLTGAPLPPGATFTPNAAKTSGTFSWTPTQEQVGDYSVTFTTSNALSANTVTAITVSTTADQNPVVTAPASLSPRANAPFTFSVTAVDPDGNAIQSLTAAPLPAGASFTPSAGNTTGTFQWTPTAAQQGSHSVTFTAANALTGWATTSISVRPPNQLPIATLAVTPATGNAPLTVTANATGSSDPDPDGGIVSYRFVWGDGTSTGPQAASTATHVYAGGTWTCTVTVTDVDGGTATATRTVIVAPAATGTNFVANPSFETNTSGWAAYGIASFTRVAGGFDGGWAMQISTTKNQSFGANDSPNSVASTGSAGTRYRCQAWVRSATATGEVRLRVQEFQGSNRVGQTTSTGVTLSPTWQMVTLDHVAAGSGNSLDLNVMDQPHGSNGPFLLDNVSIRIVTGAAPAIAQEVSTSNLEEAFGETLDLARPPLRPVLSPSPLHTRSTLSFRTTQSGPLSVVLYDLTGRRVRRLLDDPYAAAGPHQIPVDGVGDGGERLAAGVYFYRVRAVEGETVGRFVIAR